MSRPSLSQLHDHLLSDTDRALLLACARGFGQNQMHVWSLGRYGYTGARLFRVRFDPAGIGPPYVVKLDSESVIHRENAALEQARGYFHDATAWHFSPTPSNGSAALLYRLFESSGGAITELKDMYQDGSADDDNICNILNRLYEGCRAAHTCTSEERLLGDEYARYLRGTRRDRISEVFSSEPQIDFLGRRYRNPVEVCLDLSAIRSSMPIGFAHGDLHPNNVVLDAGGRPALIDFAWAHDGDIFVDYALMECSLRFLLFPQHVDWDQHRWVTERMAQEDGPAVVADHYSSVADIAHKERYVRMARTVGIIRQHALQCGAPMVGFEHYLMAQWLILYGLAKLEVYPFLQCVDALGIIGNRLLGAPK